MINNFSKKCYIPRFDRGMNGGINPTSFDSSGGMDAAVIKALAEVLPKAKLPCSNLAWMPSLNTVLGCVDFVHPHALGGVLLEVRDFYCD